LNIAIIGWGSLLKDQGDLRIRSDWNSAGPSLPLEFARISCGNRLTLVIHCDAPLQNTYWALSEFLTLDAARENLEKREGTDSLGIHTVDSADNRIGAISDIIFKIMQIWLSEREDIDAVIWTGLESNWHEKRGCGFSYKDALDYLGELIDKKEASAAEEYIRNAPVSIKTPLRRLIEEKYGWASLSRC